MDDPLAHVPIVRRREREDRDREDHGLSVVLTMVRGGLQLPTLATPNTFHFPLILWLRMLKI